MTVQLDYLPDATVLVAVALVAVSIASLALRGLRAVLIVAAIIVGIGWGLVFYSKYKDRFSLPDLPRFRLNLPTFEFKKPQTPAAGDVLPQFQTPAFNPQGVQNFVPQLPGEGRR